MNRKVLVSLFAPLLPACSGGIDLMEEVPGDSTYLESGALAVDPSTERIFVLQTTYDDTPTPSPTYPPSRYAPTTPALPPSSSAA